MSSGNLKGFTLIELLVTIAVFAVIVLIAVTSSSLVFQKNQLSEERDQLVSVLRVAQSRSVSGYADGIWGVHLTSSNYTLFQGTTYAGRTTSYDEVHTLPSGTSLSGLTDVVFSIRTGETTDTGTITLTEVVSNETKSITINGNGRITDL